jgi:hypothetical protein
LLVVRQAREPGSELIGTFDVPRHRLIMPFEALCVKGYIAGCDLRHNEASCK